MGQQGKRSIRVRRRGAGLALAAALTGIAGVSASATGPASAAAATASTTSTPLTASTAVTPVTPVSGAAGAAPAGPAVAPGRVRYYVDCRRGRNTWSGSGNRPWRTPQAMNGRWLPARSVVYLRRGCTWDGHVRIRGGTAVLVAPYGPGKAPTITARRTGKDLGAVSFGSPRGVITGIRIAFTPGAGLTLAAPGAVAQRLLIERTAFGVRFTAPRTTADRVHARDLHLFTSTPRSQNPHDDSGAVGFNVEADDVTIRSSVCVRCRARSSDYGYDGGFIEIWRKGDRLRAYHNVGYETDGFLEIGGVGHHGDTVNGVYLVGNRVSRAHGRAVYINHGGPYDIPVSHVVLRNNVIQVVRGDALAGKTWVIDMDRSNRVGARVAPPVRPM